GEDARIANGVAVSVGTLAECDGQRVEEWKSGGVEEGSGRPLFHSSTLPLFVVVTRAGRVGRPGPRAPRHGAVVFFAEAALRFFKLLAALEVLLAVEVDEAVNEDLLGEGHGAEGVVIVEDQVGVFALVDGADPAVDAELLRGVEGDEGEGLALAEA